MPVGGVLVHEPKNTGNFERLAPLSCFFGDKTSFRVTRLKKGGAGESGGRASATESRHVPSCGASRFEPATRWNSSAKSSVKRLHRGQIEPGTWVTRFEELVDTPAIRP